MIKQPEVITFYSPRYGSDINSSQNIAYHLDKGTSNWEYIIRLIESLDKILSSREGLKALALKKNKLIQTCKAWLYLLITEHCEDPDDREILYMTFGILSGYENIKNVTERRREYMKHIQHNLKPSSIDRTVKRVEEDVINEFSLTVARALYLSQYDDFKLIVRALKGFEPPIPRYASKRLRGKGPKEKS